MREIEEKIAVWRAGMSNALRADQNTVQELEDHLRDHIASLRRKCIPLDEAFAQAVAQLGEARAIAHEFQHVRPAKLPISFAKQNLPMKSLRIIVTIALRIIVTIVLGGYLLAMGLQLNAVSMDIVREFRGLTPYSGNAKAVFFPNLLVCTVCALGIWAAWRIKREPQAQTEPKA